VTVVRNGFLQDIPSEELVCGDLLILKAGDTVGADARVIWSATAKVDMSSLTGESVPVERSPDIHQVSADKAINLIFKGSAITTGTCRAIVFRVGQQTLIGTIMRLASGAQMEVGELGKELGILIRRIVLVALFTGSIFMGVAFIQGLSVEIAFEAAIGIFVAFLPQGLPMTITILLTVAAKRMAAQNVLVKSLQAVETLGSLTVIATDKTGTLTQNKMKVAGGWVENVRYDNVDDHRDRCQKILECYWGACQIDLATVTEQDIAKGEAKGDATELGLFWFAVDPHTIFADIKTRFFKDVEIPFDSGRKWNMGLHRESSGNYLAFVKGAPDRVLQLCSTVMQSNEETCPIDEQFMETFNQEYEHYASQGQRLIGFATRMVPAVEVGPFQGEPTQLNATGFTFLGMLSMLDPPKVGVKQTVDSLKFAGIKIYMVTGDHPITAEAIARQVHIITQPSNVTTIEALEDFNLANDYEALVIHGDMVDQFEERHWDKVFTVQEVVFAR
jgi:sodium/potassium-transporting ATPase subunit alpha